MVSCRQRIQIRRLQIDDQRTVSVDEVLFVRDLLSVDRRFYEMLAQDHIGFSFRIHDLKTLEWERGDTDIVQIPNVLISDIAILEELRFQCDRFRDRLSEIVFLSGSIRPAHECVTFLAGFFDGAVIPVG